MSYTDAQLGQESLNVTFLANDAVRMKLCKKFPTYRVTVRPRVSKQVTFIHVRCEDEIV